MERVSLSVALALALPLGVPLSGCGDDGDGGGDAGPDAPLDCACDADFDAGHDAGFDAGDDAGTDAGEDSGIDCSTVGCSPPSICGQCDAPCGCCHCGDGHMMTVGETELVCVGGCYVEVDGGQGDTCGGPDDCGTGLSCCYPCGIEGCENICTPTCDERQPACAGGCLLVP